LLSNIRRIGIGIGLDPVRVALLLPLLTLLLPLLLLPLGRFS
jgi:hypothetical protein